MQVDWNDLRYVAVVAQTGSFAACARAMKLDGTTVARRLQRLEKALGARLFDRDASGNLRLTRAGEIVLQRAEVVEGEIGALEQAVKGADSEVAGKVRITAVPILINRLLVPASKPLLSRNPNLCLDLVGEFRNFNLTRREADIALRLARPAPDAGSRILAKRIGTLRYAAYVSSGHRDRDDVPWFHYEEDMSHLPQARWIERAAARSGGLAGIAVNDAEAVLQGVKSGLGRGLLPCLIADRITGIERAPFSEPPFPEREVWLFSHPDMRHLARVQTTLDWIEGTFSSVDHSSSREVRCS